MEILSCENVAFKYNESTDYAISDCTFSVKKGEKIMLCGASGSGKSTLLRLLKRELSPRGELSGDITLMGKDRSELSDRESAEKIGFVMQSPDSQTVCDKVSAELAFGLESFGVKSGEIQSRVGEMAAFSVSSRSMTGIFPHSRAVRNSSSLCVPSWPQTLISCFLMSLPHSSTPLPQGSFLAF